MAKVSVKDFYNNEGWQYSGAVTHDAAINENLMPVAADYVSRVRLRISENIGEGKSLLDIGCGPIQYEEYERYSINFELRVCVDLSTEALKIAKMKIGDHGRYVVGDYLDLPPLPQAPFDGATLINVLYHVDRDKQEMMVRKILGDLSRQARLVVIYSNSRTPSAVVTRLLVSLKKVLNRYLNPRRRESGVNPIYFYRHPLSFWHSFQDIAEVKILAWRTFSPPLEKLLFRKNLFGKVLLSFLFRLEGWRWWANVAEYPMVILTKR